MAVTVIKRGMSRRRIQLLMSKAMAVRERRAERPDIYSFLGTSKMKEDPVELVRKWRDEWDESGR